MLPGTDGATVAGRAGPDGSVSHSLQCLLPERWPGLEAPVETRPCRPGRCGPPRARRDPPWAVRGAASRPGRPQPAGLPAGTWRGRAEAAPGGACGRAGAAPAAARGREPGGPGAPAVRGVEQEVAPARPGRGLRRARLLGGAWRSGGAGRRPEPEPERRERAPMAAASAAVDELSRNFTYGALGAGNGSLSGAWYRRNQVRAGRPCRPAGTRAGPPARRLSEGHGVRMLPHVHLTAPDWGERGRPRPSSPRRRSLGLGRKGLRL